MNEKILANRYRLTEQIGMGGMAIVYKAVDLRTGHNVAVKVLRQEYNEDAEFVGRFQREAEAASKMTHHNIVNLLDVGMDGENRYLIMEYVQGKTLKEVINERGRLSAPLACQIAIRILSALEHAHRNGIVHRDIKPQNILVHADGHIKVSDFGIARIADSSTLTKGDMVMGSVHYFSPEQARGEAANATSDIYSTGVVLYEMLTGRVPYDGETPVAVAMQHLHAQPTPIQAIAPDVPPSVVQICMKAMEKNPAMRYQSARDMAADLRVALDERGERPVRMEEDTNIQLPPPHVRPSASTAKRRKKTRTPTPTDEKKKRHFWNAISIMVTAAVIIGLGFFIWNQIRGLSTTITIPQLTGMNRNEAGDTLVKLGIDPRLIQYVGVWHSQVEENIVTIQSPRAGTVVSKEEMTLPEETEDPKPKIILNYSKGPMKQDMPDLAQKNVEEAKKILRGMQISNITVNNVVSNEPGVNLVISTEPEAMTKIDAKTVSVILNVCGGDVTVPNLVGMKLDEVEKLISAGKLGLNSRLEYQETEDPGQHGRVAGQSPDAGNRVIEQTLITLKLYRCNETAHKSKLMIKLPPPAITEPPVQEPAETDQPALQSASPSSSEIAVKVVIQSKGGTGENDFQNPGPELVMHAESHNLTEENVIEVPLIYPDDREYIVSYYLDNVLQKTLDSSQSSDDLFEAP